MNSTGSPKRVLFRADASVAIGTGHVMRCMTLADALRGHGAEVIFACRTLPGDLNQWLRQQGYAVWEWQSERPSDWLPEGENVPAHKPFDWLVVDHYGLDAAWERQMRPYAQRILVIDDLADRPHECDWLLDQNDMAQTPERYSPLLPAHCRTLLGPAYALLRPDFYHWRDWVLANHRRETPVVQEVLVFFGGSDPTGETVKALKALKPLAGRFLTSVITGASNPWREEIQAICAAMPNVAYSCQVDNMAERMARADIAIGAGGTATWERLSVGLPAIVISVAENQRAISAHVAASGAQWYLGQSESVSEQDIDAAVSDLMMSAPSRVAFSNAALSLVDGQGVRRVLKAMDMAIFNSV